MDAIPKSDIKSDIRFGKRFDIRIKQTTWIGHKADYKTFIPFGINARTIYFPSINYTTKQRYIQQNVKPKNLSSGKLSLVQNC